MEKYKLNIDKVTKTEDLYYSGWLFQDMKQHEIVLETSHLNLNPIVLKATFAVLCEGILNSHRNSADDARHEIEFEKFDIPDLETLAQQLTNITGINFSSALIV